MVQAATGIRFISKKKKCLCAEKGVFRKWVSHLTRATEGRLVDHQVLAAEPGDLTELGENTPR